MEQWPLSLPHFDFRVCQNSPSNIRAATRNPGANSCPPASRQVVDLMPVALSCLCRGPVRKQKITRPSCDSLQRWDSLFPSAPRPPSALTQWEAAADHRGTSSELICFLMETPGPYFSRERSKARGLLPSWVLSMQVTAAKYVIFFR